MLSRTPAISMSRSTRTSGSSISVMRRVSPRSSSCSRCQAASASTSTASAADRVGHVARQAALLADLAEREAAARGLEQVRGEQRVVDEVRRDELERLGVVGDHLAVAERGDELLGAVAVADEHAVAGRDGEAPRRALGEQLALGRRAARGRPRRPRRRRRARATSASVPSRMRAAIVSLGDAARAPPRRRRRTPPRGAGAGERSSNSRKTSRSFERSGGRAASATGSTSTGTSRMIVASCLLTRASSACSVRFCLRLAPEMSSTWSSTLSSDPNCCSSCDAVLSPMPGTPGMLSDVSPLRP